MKDDTAKPERKKKARRSRSGKSSLYQVALGRWQGKTPKGKTHDEGFREDHLLATRCLDGDVSAWDELYRRFHEPLSASIKVLLGYEQCNLELVDEIAARVWYVLVADDGELLSRYQPQRGARLITFLRSIAKDETARHFRSERRRRERELAAYREKPDYHDADPVQPAAALTDFLGTLTPHERGFCGDYLLSASTESGGKSRPNHSSANIWQLSRRIQKKLLSFLDEGEE